MAPFSLQTASSLMATLSHVRTAVEASQRLQGGARPVLERRASEMCDIIVRIILQNCLDYAGSVEQAPVKQHVPCETNNPPWPVPDHEKP